MSDEVSEQGLMDLECTLGHVSNRPSDHFRWFEKAHLGLGMDQVSQEGELDGPVLRYKHQYREWAGTMRT